MDVLQCAKDAGFELSAVITLKDIVTDEKLAASCSPANCPHYASCWSCPPGAGSYEERQAHFEGKDAGLLVQTVRDGVDFSDLEKLSEIRDVHHERLDWLAGELKRQFTGVLEFSTGGCDLCSPCSYPDAPCIKPDEQRLSLSAHGVDVGATCNNAGLAFSFENGRIRYVGMILYARGV